MKIGMISGAAFRRRVGHIAALAAVATLVFASAARAEDKVQLLFTQRDAIQAFDLVTGRGFQTGTAIGKISGTSFVDFQLTPSGPPTGDVLPITFHNHVIITD